MKLPRLITDNTPKLLLEEGRKPLVKPLNQWEDLFGYLKEKVLDDLDRMLTADTDDKKLNALSDIYTDLNEYGTRLASRMPDFVTKMAMRAKRMGGFNERFLLSGVEKRAWTDDDYVFVMSEGERLNYPKVNLSKNENGQTYESVSGKEGWEKMIEGRLNHSEQDLFMKFVAALRRGDYEQAE